MCWWNVWPLGYVTGRTVPEQKGAETDSLFGADSPGEGAASPESTKAVPETVSTKNSGSVIPEETPTVAVPEFTLEEANIKSQPEAGPDRLGFNGLTAGETGATGKLNLDTGLFTRVGLHV